MFREEVQNYSNKEIAAELGTRYREYRKWFGLTQKDVSEQTGLSLFTISMFENGKGKNISLSHFLSLLRAVHMLEGVRELLPDLPESPRLLWKKLHKGD